MPVVTPSARAACLAVLLAQAVMGAEPAVAAQITGVQSVPSGSVRQHEKLEISFQIAGSTASMMQWPYDPAPPNGIPPGVGISVSAVFTDPSGRAFAQPAFYAQEFLDEVRDGRDWHLPTDNFSWKVRFSPNRPGNWTYRIVATDRNGTIESASFGFSVTAPIKPGFINVSKADPRYFEFDDGTLFTAKGFEFTEALADPVTVGAPAYQQVGTSGANLVRIWISSIFGSAWTPYVGGRNQYIGYLPVTGLIPFSEPTSGTTTLTMRIDYEQGGDQGWFDACRLQWWDDPESIKPRTNYRLRIDYYGTGITGPRDVRFPNYGLVGKLGGWFPNCYESNTSTRVTSYGMNTTGWGRVDGNWYSGDLNFLPKLHLALENANQGTAYIRSISLREDLGGGVLGPEIMIKPSMEHQLYIPEEKAFALDRAVAAAEQSGVFLKLVIMDKEDKIYKKMQDDGSWVTTEDNADGFYGLGRSVNKTRWLQQVWWRYLQARWGYSPSIHSWELTNEGDPASTVHYQMTDEFGKYMHCRVFGVEPGSGDGAKCTLDHPNDHLVTTSFWHSFPASQFWANSRYPNVDYADVHAYVSTSYAPLAEREAMQWDAAHFHLWHSADVGGWRIGKPVIRGEAGLDSTTQQTDTVLGLNRDTTGVWLHNYLWSGLDSGGLHELYWWTSHIWSSGFDHRGAYKAVQNLMANVPLNRGGYVDWGGSVTNPALRVVGQKNPGSGALHLWVQNRQHTWKNVVDGVAITGASGIIVVPGFSAGASYALERWDTYAPGGRIASMENVVADSAGSLSIVVTGISTDVALKIQPGGLAPRPPTNVRVIRN